MSPTPPRTPPGYRPAAPRPAVSAAGSSAGTRPQATVQPDTGPDTRHDARHNEAPQILSVGALARSARVLLEERFNQIWVEGELSNFRKPGSGHWYFTLKDDAAQVSCAMFAGNNRRVRIPVKDGDRVLLRGRVSLYEARGSFQIIAEHIEPAGEGALRAAFDALKDRLAAEGLFDDSRKRSLPPRPQRIAVLSSASGAALRDFLHTIRRRYPAVEVLLLPVTVQGDRAGPEIVAALGQLATLDVDLAVLTRGGGSLEDLWAFNLEAVARAMADSPVPLISAIGHQTDFTIADFVADLRAATPTAAAELITPDGTQLAHGLRQIEGALATLIERHIADQQSALDRRRLRLVDPRRDLEQQMRRADDLDLRLGRALQRRLRQRTDRLLELADRLQRQPPARRVAEARERLSQARQRLKRVQQQTQLERQQRVTAGLRMLDAVSPAKTLDRGFAAVLDSTGQVVSRADQVQPGDRLSAFLARGRLELTVLNQDPEGRLTDVTRDVTRDLTQNVTPNVTQDLQQKELDS